MQQNKPEIGECILQLMDGGKEWLEVILKRKAYEDAPIKILEIEEKPAPGKGVNYLSQVRKGRVKVLLGSGKCKRVSFFIKCEHQTEHLKKMSLDGGIFLKEISMYRDVFPKMLELLEEIGEEDEIVWARSYDFRLYDRLVLEDLEEHGYRMADRVNQLSLNAALLAVKSLGKFHALSKILMDRGDVPVDIVGVRRWVNDPDYYVCTKRMIENNVTKMSRLMESWGDEWKEASERLKSADLGKSFIDLLEAQPGEFVVLCHGDIWINNMMFQGDLENPNSCRFVDFQLCFKSSPAKDLSQLFISSVRLTDRELHLNLLLRTYTDTLNSYLTKLRCGGNAPTFEDIVQSYERRGIVHLCDAIGVIPLAMGDADDSPDVEEEMRKLNEAKTRGQEICPDIFGLRKKLKPQAEAIIKREIEKAIKSGII